jgi:hypothetical protein
MGTYMFKSSVMTVIPRALDVVIVHSPAKDAASIGVVIVTSLESRELIAEVDPEADSFVDHALSVRFTIL